MFVFRVSKELQFVCVGMCATAPEREKQEKKLITSNNINAQTKYLRNIFNAFNPFFSFSAYISLSWLYAFFLLSSMLYLVFV